MKIEDVMTRRVVAARADTELAHVARLMWDNDCGAVPVVDAEDKVVGILTDRDVCMGAHFSGKSLREQRVSGCMASEVLTCRPGDALVAVVGAMAKRKVRRIPVTDETGRLVGLVSVGDLFAAHGRARTKDRKALGEALLALMASITARPVADEVVPAAPPSKKTDKSAAPRKAEAKPAKVAARPKKRVKSGK